MLSGLLLPAPGDDGDARQLKELYFNARTASADRRAACSPRTGWQLVSLYGPRTQTLSVLARPDWRRLKLPAARGVFRFPLVAQRVQCRALLTLATPTPAATP
jgi:hypothetical protein